MSSRLIIVFSSIMILPLLSSQAEAECPAFPQVSWWGTLTHEGVIGYVNQKHGGDWAGYLEKWSRQLANVRTIYGQGKGIKIPSTGITIKGLQLSDYIDKLAQRVDINLCLSKETEPATVSEESKTSDKKFKITVFGQGVNAYRAGDFKLAREIWLPLAIEGNAKAQNALGHLYRKGLGVVVDLAVSRRWYGKSAAQNDPVGLYSFGDLSRREAKSKAEMATALSLIEKSANLNYAAGQYAMAVIYHQGKEVAADDSEAYFWNLLAQENNYKKAPALMEILDKSVSAIDKDIQSERVKEWLAKLKK
ncbi:MAG: sel1 repeat family protein [Rhodospirillales bacterium]|nr:sel1 repeat family protein [Rhodospirillales bacterium]